LFVLFIVLFILFVLFVLFVVLFVVLLLLFVFFGEVLSGEQENSNRHMKRYVLCMETSVRRELCALCGAAQSGCHEVRALASFPDDPPAAPC